jgi:hypothetical protein
MWNNLVLLRMQPRREAVNAGADARRARPRICELARLGRTLTAPMRPCQARDTGRSARGNQGIGAASHGGSGTRASRGAEAAGE